MFREGAGFLTESRQPFSCSRLPSALCVVLLDSHLCRFLPDPFAQTLFISWSSQLPSAWSITLSLFDLNSYKICFVSQWISRLGLSICWPDGVIEICYVNSLGIRPIVIQSVVLLLQQQISEQEHPCTAVWKQKLRGAKAWLGTCSNAGLAQSQITLGPALFLREA